LDFAHFGPYWASIEPYINIFAVFCELTFNSVNSRIYASVAGAYLKY